MKYFNQNHAAMKLVSFAAVCFLQACANDPHSIGIKQIKEGSFVEGLSNLKKASADSPATSVFRADYLRERDRLTNQLLYEAAGFRIQDDLDRAENIYNLVLENDRENVQAKQGLNDVARLKRHRELIASAKNGWSRGEKDASLRALQSVLLENPNNLDAAALVRQYTEEQSGLVAQSGMLPVLGEAYKRPVSLQYRDANLKMILESISRTSGINIIIDREVKNDLKATLFVQKSSVEDTLNLLLMQNQLEKRIINENTVYIYPITAAKTKEQQDLVVRVFQLVNADPKQMQNMLKTVLKVKESFVNEKSNSIIIRDTPEVAALAAKLLSSQDVNEPEIMLEVEVIEIARNTLKEIGLSYPDQITLNVANSAATAATSSAAASTGLSLQALRNINSSGINVYSGSGGLNLALKLKQQDGDVDILASPKIRVRQREKAKIHIGDRVPIITNTVTPQTTGTALYTGAVQYIEVGIKLDVEPDIHSDGEVGIKTSLEVSSISSTVTDPKTLTTAYQIGTRTASTVLRLKDGETQILAGLLNNTDLKGATKVPGLGDIPFFGRLFSSHSQDKRKTEIVLAMTPRIIRNIRQPDADQTTYWSGTDNAVKILPIMSGKTEVIRMDGQGVVTGGRPLRTPVLPQPTPVPVAAEPAAPVRSNTAPAVDNKAPAQMAPEKPAPMVSVPAPVSVPVVPAGQSTRQQLITDAFRVAPAPLKAPQPEKSSATEEAPQAADTQ